MLSWQAHSSAATVQPHKAPSCCFWSYVKARQCESRGKLSIVVRQKSCTLICHFVKGKAATVNKFLCHSYVPCIQHHNWWNHHKAMFFLPRRKGSGWQKSQLHHVPSQQIRNRTREAQRNQDSLLQTGIVFISKAGLKWTVQTAEIRKSQTVKVFAQCTTGNYKANIIYGTKFFKSQKPDLCEVQ